jgi:hypothetical protein
MPQKLVGGQTWNWSMGRIWRKLETVCHINVLEMNAAFFALKSLVFLKLKCKHVKIMVDNSTAVLVINNMGTSHNDKLKTIAVQIWEFGMIYQIKITAAHLPGSTDVIANNESRNVVNCESEWMLNSSHIRTELNKFRFQASSSLLTITRALVRMDQRMLHYKRVKFG